MASSIKVVFRKEKMSSKGDVPLYLRIIKDRKPKYIGLGISVPENLWDEENKRVKKGMQNSQRINNWIANKLAEAENQMLQMETSDKNISSSNIKANIIGKSSPNFFEYSETYMKLIKGKVTGSTLVKVNAVVGKMKEYCKQKPLTFEQITVRWLKEYEHHLRTEKKNKNNTVFANMKIIRRIINDAVRDRVIKLDENPFLHYKYSWEKTIKNFCSEEEILAIENVLLNPGTSLFNTRNAYIFSAYAGGLRISDICKLKKKNYDGERIFIYTKKCKGVPVSIKLPQKAINILNIYCKKGDNSDDFVFPFLDNALDYSDEDFLTRAIASQGPPLNNDLRKITKLAEVEKYLTFHTSRHTWATRALRKGMRIEYVSKLMGHSDIKTTQVYAKIVNEELDKAMDVFNEPVLIISRKFA